MRDLTLDIETYSSEDLGETGVHRYAESPDFEIQLLSYCFDDEEVRTVDPAMGDELPDELRAALTDPGVRKWAHNAAFERTCLAAWLGVPMPAEQWWDDMVLCAVCGLPMSLGEAGAALGMPEDKAKDRAGKALVRWFSQPYKATKKRPGGRHMPADYPEKWEQYREYNRQDVVAERAIHNMLRRWIPGKTEHRAWVVDQGINDRGIRVDLDLARNAVAFDARYKAQLTEQAIAVSGLENPNSVTQIKAWLLEQEGLAVPSLNKKVVADVVAQLQTDRARQFMDIRKELSKSSTAKYSAMVRSVCADEHVRGCFQFCGAGRTGRWAGRRVQLQNLAKNKMEDIGTCRELVRTGDYETLELLYGNVTGCLSELVRTALIPEEGQRFIVCDYSAIEARVLAWISGEEWALEEFRGAGQIYEATGAMMFHVPKETIAKGGCNHDKRQAAKTAVLACVAEGQLVLTDRGPVPIESVDTDDLLWDGAEWVRHEGVAFQGIQSTVLVNGVELTDDHKILTEKGMMACGNAAGLNWADVRLPDGPGTRCGAHEPLRAGIAEVALPVRMRKCEGNPGGSPDPNEEADQVLRMYVPGVGRGGSHEAWDDGHEAVQHLEPDAAAVRQPEGQELVSLRRAGHSRLRQVAGKFSELLRRHGPHMAAGTPDRTSGQLSGVLPGKLHLGHAVSAGAEQAEQYPGIDAPGGYDAGGTGRAGRAQIRDSAIQVLPEKAVAVRRGRRAVKTYDLINAGPRHRFCLVDHESGALRCVSNCGYGGGVNALKAFGADKMGMTEEDMVETVDLWRAANKGACKLWRELERAAIRSVVHGGTALSRTGNIRFDFEQGILWMTLPSGRRIAYFGARYGDSKWGGGRRALSYMGIDQDKHKWSRLETWGGKLTENCWAAGTPVLTGRGWVPIESVTSADRVWDGVEWVSTDGCARRDREEDLFELDGLLVTGDHKILTTRGWKNAKECDGLDRVSVQLYDAAVPAGPRLSVRPAARRAGHDTPVYDVVNCGPRRRYVVLGATGPIIAHNCVQATARDCLRDAMQALTDAGFQIRAHIHDEVVISEPRDGRTLDEVSAIMGRELPWAPGLPLRGDGYYCDYYIKD